MEIEYSIINYQSPLYLDVISLRNEELRKPLGLDINQADIAEDKDQYIVIATDQNTLVGCLMIKIVDKDRVKFRQMAVKNNFQKKGLGRHIIHFAENFCLLNNYTTVELHARCVVEEFYLKQGYQKQGQEFMEVNIPHIKLTKQLT
ncbi:MAG: GNAT family N-acetyltransferase [Chitinophagaceae bacterium]